jgi:flagellar hook-associated protein 1 FlgK
VSNIASINARLNNQPVKDNLNQQSADLLDQRDRLMQQLAEKIDIRVINERENNLSIFIGNGQTILTGSQAFELDAVPNISDPRQDIIVYKGVSQINDISAALTGGGELGALLEFRDTILQDTRNDLGRVAIALADSFNDQHNSGMDLNGNLGDDFFTFASPSVTPYANNAGLATISVEVTDVTALTRFDYDLQYADDGAGTRTWTLVSDSGASSTPVNALDPAATTLTFEGLTVTIAGAAMTAVNGDRFRIKPTVDGAGSIQVAVSDPLRIAAAGPLRSSSSLSNTGDLRVSTADVVSFDDFSANLPTPGQLSSFAPATFQFVSATQFTVSEHVSLDGGATVITAGTNITFTNGMTIEAVDGPVAPAQPLWSVQLTGNSPQTGDVFTVQANTGGQGDNRNALALGNLQVTGILDGGNADFQEGFSNLVGRVGTLTAAYDNQRIANEALMFQARDRRDGKTAVNLDEEAADLIKFQQAYEAAARVIGSVQVMFDSLIAATR